MAWERRRKEKGGRHVGGGGGAGPVVKACVREGQANRMDETPAEAGRRNAAVG